jgi:hypothetical protein
LISKLGEVRLVPRALFHDLSNEPLKPDIAKKVVHKIKTGPLSRPAGDRA